MARWVRRRVPAGRVLAIPNQKRGVLERYGLTRAEADREVWTIDRDGTRAGGAAAINRVLREVGGPWSVVGSIYGFPPLALIQDTGYGWFAANRSRFHRFGIPPECDEPGSDCI
ncbi:MAG TPA: DCC1-like thiol-disulfide oxidoreductase family protein [Candidatus Dormibacteraeota bacterium]|nr:DCC1-like thiol-disulfide oxidoreductase family protein [Candidatus Dormibacteraeota bacterium]